jgi:NAD(P)-dependent dehydrogenase (short-subunit alcohol dehydrogenase family)
LRFQDKVCVVTGASSGIGRRTALDLAADGARVCIAARRSDRLQEVLEAMGGEARNHSMVVADVAKKSDVRSLGAHVRRTYGRLDVLVNNAGISAHSGFSEQGGVATLEKVMKVNFFGAVYCTAEFLPLLVAAAPSHVVNISSVAGRLALGGSPAYCASKFAMVGWSEALHFELRPKGVFVSVIEPGLIPTEGFPQTIPQQDRLMRYTLGTVEDVSAAIRHAIARRKLERTVPRWYYLLQIPRLLTPPLYRLVNDKLVAPRRAPGR